MYINNVARLSMFDAFDGIGSGDLIATGTVSEYTLPAKAYNALLEAHNANKEVSVNILWDKDNAVSVGAWKSDTPGVGRAIKLPSFNVRAEIGGIETFFSLDFASMYGILVKGAKTLKPVLASKKGTRAKEGSETGETETYEIPVLYNSGEPEYIGKQRFNLSYYLVRGDQNETLKRANECKEALAKFMPQDNPDDLETIDNDAKPAKTTGEK